ncbi:hypothetical protein [Paraburkholderia humisilvae]|uniref:Uncharacterized protein n=1 Tax=Paraburkholderia humisilvae TaxID=627669 RepID=A0A6J5E0J2_9BURK|nr:hypothetical protein [Paraburkholderia humisilvae]CAB3758655.1 hypothetical protein LMG29542_03397 [Paraburkholderia humisilvae]
MNTMIEQSGTEWIFQPTRRKRETEAREMLAAYVGADAETRDGLRAGWIDLLMSRQVFADDAHRAELLAKHEAFMGKLDEQLDAYVANPGDGERDGLVKTYRSFVRRLVLPHHYV